MLPQNYLALNAATRGAKTAPTGRRYGAAPANQNATLQQTAVIADGTGQFTGATGSFTATVSGPALLPRNPDGSCDFNRPTLHEEDMFTDSGTLSS